MEIFVRYIECRLKLSELNMEEEEMDNGFSDEVNIYKYIFNNNMVF